MKNFIAPLALAAALPFAAQAQEAPSNTWIEGQYLNVDGDADGHGLRGAFAFGDTGLYGLAGYSRVGIHDTPFRIDSHELGLGYAHALSNRTQLFAEAAYLDTELTGFVTIDGTGIIDANGYRGSVGVRSALTERFEGLAKANYVDGDDFDGDFTGTVGGLYKFTPTWGLSGDVTFGDGAQVYSLGLRASF